LAGKLFGRHLRHSRYVAKAYSTAALLRFAGRKPDPGYFRFVEELGPCAGSLQLLRAHRNPYRKLPAIRQRHLSRGADWDALLPAGSIIFTAVVGFPLNPLNPAHHAVQPLAKRLIRKAWLQPGSSYRLRNVDNLLLIRFDLFWRAGILLFIFRGVQGRFMLWVCRSGLGKTRWRGAGPRRPARRRNQPQLPIKESGRYSKRRYENDRAVLIRRPHTLVIRSCGNRTAGSSGRVLNSCVARHESQFRAGRNFCPSGNIYFGKRKKEYG
jgi:hypothetical protein